MSETGRTMDEFERRLHLSSLITTLSDVLSKTSPTTLISESLRKELESAGLKDQYQAACKKWLDMYMHYLDKIDALGVNYPIESLLGIKKGSQ
ncbi:MAG: hypothetical protein QXT64_01565 [Desulfurococcaceae archaeon]